VLGDELLAHPLLQPCAARSYEVSLAQVFHVKHLESRREEAPPFLGFLYPQEQVVVTGQTDTATSAGRCDGPDTARETGWMGPALSILLRASVHWMRHRRQELARTRRLAKMFHVKH
jgi:hypothetical protein